MGASEQGTTGFCTEERHMGYFAISGSTPKEILTRYTHNLAGTSPAPQIWKFGLWLSRNSYPNWAVADEIITQAKSAASPSTTPTSTHPGSPNTGTRASSSPKTASRTTEPKWHLLDSAIHASLWQYTFALLRDDNNLYLEDLVDGYFGCERLPDGSSGPKLFSHPLNFVQLAARRSHNRLLQPGDLHLTLGGNRFPDRQGASAVEADFGDLHLPRRWLPLHPRQQVPEPLQLRLQRHDRGGDKISSPP
jgi:hypothetical protein